jgi:hydrogenase/urease accessory protein HupE
VAAVIVGFFALFHGHAHGTELPPGSSSLLYSIGFVIATGLVGARQGMIMMQSRIGDSGRSCILSI